MFAQAVTLVQNNEHTLINLPKTVLAGLCSLAGVAERFIPVMTSCEGGTNKIVIFSTMLWLG